MRPAAAIPAAPVSAPPVFDPERPWLAPLAGYSDLPFRLLCREYGAAVCETEMISAKGLLYETKRTYELLRTTPEDSPLVVQIFGGDPDSVKTAAVALRGAGYRYIDFNAGCSVRKVARQGAGAALLGDAALFMRIAKALIKAVKDEAGTTPGMVGFKLRLGVARGREVLPDLALALEDAGADWITLHPRYAKDGFSGAADWDEIGRLAERVSIPVIGSGDLFTATDGINLISTSDASTVMYARGALYNPDIFNEHKNLLTGRTANEPDKNALAKIIRRHIELARIHGPEKRAFVKTRSLIPRYVRAFPGAASLRGRLCEVPDWDALNELLYDFFRGAPEEREERTG